MHAQALIFNLLCRIPVSGLLFAADNLSTQDERLRPCGCRTDLRGRVEGWEGGDKKGERGFETVSVRAPRQNALSVRDRGQRQRHTSVRRSHSGRRPAGVHPAAAAAADNKASVSSERRHSNVDGAQRDLSILRAATFHRQAFQTQQGGRRDEAA